MLTIGTLALGDGRLHLQNCIKDGKNETGLENLVRVVLGLSQDKAKFCSLGKKEKKESFNAFQ